MIGGSDSLVVEQGVFCVESQSHDNQPEMQTGVWDWDRHGGMERERTIGAYLLNCCADEGCAVAFVNEKKAALKWSVVACSDGVKVY